MPDEPSKPPAQPQTYAQAAAEGTPAAEGASGGANAAGTDSPPPYGQTDTSISVTGISNGKGDGAAQGPSGAGPSTHVNAVQAPAPSPAAFTHPAARPHHPAQHRAQHHAHAHNAAHGHIGRHRDVEAGVVLFIPEREIALARARRRFFGAVCWAFVIYLVIASITGSTIHDVSRRGRHGHWDHNGVWQESAGASGTTVV